MTATSELYQEAKRAAGCESDYAFAKRLGVSRQVVCNWASGKKTFGDEHAQAIAEILGREPGEVMAICQAERSKDAKSRGAWLRVAALLAAIGAGPSAHAGTPSFDNNATNLQIMRNRRGLLASIFGAPWPVQTI